MTSDAAKPDMAAAGSTWLGQIDANGPVRRSEQNCYRATKVKLAYMESEPAH